MCRNRIKYPMRVMKNKFSSICRADIKGNLLFKSCLLVNGLDFSLAPWPGMKLACLRVLYLYCKVFDQFELFELIVR